MGCGSNGFRAQARDPVPVFGGSSPVSLRWLSCQVVDAGGDPPVVAPRIHDPCGDDRGRHAGALQIARATGDDERYYGTARQVRAAILKSDG